MSPPEKKKKRKTKKLVILPTQSTPNPSLPYDLLLSCFARVSRLYYPTLSLVSKSFSSLITSPELYNTRSSLGRTTESCLYVCLQYGPNPNPNPNPRWFTLCRKPDQTLTSSHNKSSGNYVLAPIPIHHSPQANQKVVVAVGSSIYAIGGPINNSPSASVWILDCMSHTWREAPRMQVKRSYPTANVVDGKIYVVGGIKDFNSSNWMEVFDPKTQTWENVLNPLIERCDSQIDRSALIEGVICMSGNEREGVAYEPKEDRWQVLEYLYPSMDRRWRTDSYCTIDNVLYCCRGVDGIQWYDTSRRDWMDLKSLKRLLKLTKYRHVRLLDYGGKMVVLWDRRINGYENKVIWCAVITLEKRFSAEIREIWGKVEWSDVVLTVPKYYGFVCAVAATV